MRLGPLVPTQAVFSVFYSSEGATFRSPTRTLASEVSSLASAVFLPIYTAPGAFPTSVFSSYYGEPTATASQVQPVVEDPITHAVYPLNLTSPDTIPFNNTHDPHPLPPRAPPSAIYEATRAQILSLAESSLGRTNACSACTSALTLAKIAVMAEPALGPRLAVDLCEHFRFEEDCAGKYAAGALGHVVTQVVANADTGGLDGKMICANFLGQCPIPPPTPLDLTGWFAKPKPSPLPSPRPRGRRLKVLHLSDLHLDPRYATGSEADCASGLCCRANNSPSEGTPITFPAPRFGAFKCDSPFALVVAALQAIPKLAGTEDTDFAWTIYTGDLVSHDPDKQISRDYVKWSETTVYGLFHRLLGAGPVYAALGNHDGDPGSQHAPHSIGGELAEQFQWNYDHVAALWRYEGWISDEAAKQARAHYAAYAVRRHDGLRIITLNTDMWYKFNYFNYINMSNPDVSGMLRFLTDELQEAEDIGERVWIIGHVLSGWDGWNGLQNPTDLFYEIVDRFSPHVIANIFWGHSHEDQLSIYYANNATVQNADTAQTVSWIGPSITPLNNINSGFRVYEVDSNTFDILDAHTWVSDVSRYPELDGQLERGPIFEYEYSTRKAYGGSIKWGYDEPLNATWWHLVTEAMEIDTSLVDTFNKHQGKNSVRTKPCTGDCVAARICYMRSGSTTIARKNCQMGHGSVQRMV